jgi:eukaryotic-like serine/threonine-protein kinase
VVWRATHGDQPVAVKLIRGATSDYAAFEREIQAVAGLNHPGIVVVYDHGLVTEQEAADSSRHLVPGTPYLAMELAEGGLSSGPAPSWEVLRGWLSQVLGALAHAHARGVIHLDIKPANLLAFHGRTVLKLADFGIAWRGGQTAGTEARGTPAYMAPEQIRGLWRDFRPATDLYAVGCMAWRMVTGARPFGSVADDWIAKKLYGEPFPFKPVIDLPAGMEAWLATLMARDQRERFQRAAEAARALGELGTLQRGAEPPRARPFGQVPPSWRTDEPSPRAHLLGAGLGLYGLRRPNMVGRLEERDRLWAALRDVHSTRQPAAVVLSGAPGCGKSHLARWLCERAHALASATWLRALHQLERGPMSGIEGMIHRHLRLDDLTRPEVARRIATLPGAQVAELTELVRPLGREEDPEGVPRVRLDRPADRRAVATRFLRVLAEQRLLVVWLDDLHWGEPTHALEVLEQLAGPVLLLATLHAHAAAEGLTALIRHPRTTVIEIPELSEQAQGSLVRDLLGLDGALATAVQRRAAGVPLFAVQLVGDWVRRGILVPGEHGFQLRPGAPVTLPDELHTLWLTRIGHLGSDQAAALELAAVLGRVVVSQEWWAACRIHGLPEPTRLVDQLVTIDLAHREAGQDWAFVHDMLRESLNRRARERGALPGLRDAAGLALHDRAEEHRARGHLAEAAALLERASRHAEALELHIRIEATRAVVLLDRGQLHAARRLLEAQRDRSMDCDIGLQVRILGNLGSAYRELGQTEQTLHCYQRALALADACGNLRYQGMLLGLLGNLHLQQGSLDEAQIAYARALEIDREISGGRDGNLLGNLAVLFLMKGSHAESRRCYDQALAAAQRRGDRRSQGTVLGNRAFLRDLEGDLAAAAADLRASVALLQQVGAQHLAGDYLGFLARVEAQLGEDAAARAHLAESADLVGPSDNPLFVGRLLRRTGHMHLWWGELEPAVAALEAMRGLLERLREPPQELATAVAKLEPVVLAFREGQTISRHMPGHPVFDGAGVISG